MSHIVFDTQVSRGSVTLNNIPLADETEVRVIVLPKADLSKMSYKRSQEALRGLRGNLANDIIADRGRE